MLTGSGSRAGIYMKTCICSVNNKEEFTPTDKNDYIHIKSSDQMTYNASKKQPTIALQLRAARIQHG